METYNSLLRLLVRDTGQIKDWNSNFKHEELDLKEIEGELFLLKIMDDFLLKSVENLGDNSILGQCKSMLPICQAILDSIWEKLNTGVWKDVPHYLRRLFSHVSLIKSFALYGLFHYGDQSRIGKENLRNALKSIDLGLLLGIPNADLTVAARLISAQINKITCINNRDGIPTSHSSKKIRLEGSATKVHANETKSSVVDTFSHKSTTETPWRNWRQPRHVPVLERPSLEKFSVENFHPRKPVILKGCLCHWPALSSWSPSYLAQVAGERTVPIELGPNYAHPAWSQKLMAVNEFVDRHILSENETDSSYNEIGYLAQHPLFEQVPELRADIKVPEYCCLTDNIDSNDDAEVEEPIINAWFGPKGTVSPLHHDPKHNLLAQVVGKKRVILYSCEDSSKLHPFEGQLLNNTSQVDPEDSETIEKFPDIAAAESWECEIQPGDMLYIPPKWWHHVRSLSTSFSVSFWWQ